MLGILFMPPNRVFKEGELIIQNPFSDKTFDKESCIAYAGKCIPFMQNGLWMSYGEPNPISASTKKSLEYKYQHYDYILPDEFIRGVKYIQRYMYDNRDYFDECIVDDGSMEILIRCNTIITRSSKLFMRDMKDDLLYIRGLGAFLEGYDTIIKERLSHLAKVEVPFKYPTMLYHV